MITSWRRTKNNSVSEWEIGKDISLSRTVIWKHSYAAVMPKTQCVLTKHDPVRDMHNPIQNIRILRRTEDGGK